MKEERLLIIELIKKEIKEVMERENETSDYLDGIIDGLIKSINIINQRC